MEKDKIIRIRVSTYNRLRKNFKPFENETVWGYFDRLSKHVKETINKNVGKEDEKIS